MKDNRFVLSAGQSHALEMAMNRSENGEWTPELVHKLCQEDNLGFVRDLLVTGRRKIMVPAEAVSWREEEGVIYLSLTSDGRNGEEWLETFDSLDVNTNTHGGYKLIGHKSFVPTKGVTYNLAIWKWENLRLVQSKNRYRHFDRTDNYWKVDGVIKEAADRGWERAPIEVLCLIGEALPRHVLKKMGLQEVCGTHEPLVYDEGGFSCKGLLKRSREYGFTIADDNSIPVGGSNFVFEVSRTVR